VRRPEPDLTRMRIAPLGLPPGCPGCRSCGGRGR
jgi:hypothetical protein